MLQKTKLQNNQPLAIKNLNNKHYKIHFPHCNIRSESYEKNHNHEQLKLIKLMYIICPHLQILQQPSL